MKYTYWLQRPFGIGTFPKEGFESHSLPEWMPKNGHGIVTYSRPLSVDEMKRFELIPDSEISDFFEKEKIIYLFDTEDLDEGYYYSAVIDSYGGGYLPVIRIKEFDPKTSEDYFERQITALNFIEKVRSGKWKKLKPDQSAYDQIIEYKNRNKIRTEKPPKGNFESKLKVLYGILKAKSEGTYSIEEEQFGEEVLKKLHAKEKIMNRTSLENLAFKKYNITSPKTVKEMMEAATFLASDEIVKKGKKHNLSRDVIFQLLLENYGLQVNLSARFSETVQYQQYSTPYPICYLMSEFVGVTDQGEYFEPTAGNAGMTIGSNRKKFVVNELDKFRIRTLNLFDCKYTIMSDATDVSLYRAFPQRFDGVLGNPPFGSMSEKMSVDGFSAKFKNLERYILLWSLTTMKKQGRLAFIIGGHFQKSEKSNEPLKDVDLVFLTNIGSKHRISDVINIKGDLYAKMGTRFDVCLILIDGSVEKPIPASFFNTDEATKAFSTTPVTTYQDLFKRVIQHI